MVYLSISKADVVEQALESTAPTASPSRRRATLGILGGVAVATIALLAVTNSQPALNAADCQA